MVASWFFWLMWLALSRGWRTRKGWLGGCWVPTARPSSTSRSLKRRQPTRYPFLLLPGEADYPVPSPRPPYGQAWGQLCGEQRVGQRKERCHQISLPASVYWARTMLSECWDLFQSVTPVLFIFLPISSSPFKYLSGFPVLGCNAE